MAEILAPLLIGRVDPEEMAAALTLALTRTLALTLTLTRTLTNPN